jgi:hypothetical protein
MDIYQRQIKEVLDEDNKAKQRVFNFNLRNAKLIPEAPEQRIELDARIKYNLSRLFTTLRTELEDIVNTSNSGEYVADYSSLIASYNDLVAYIQSFVSVKLNLKDKSDIDQQFRELYPLLDLVNDIASSSQEKPVNFKEWQEMYKYAKSSRQPVKVGNVSGAIKHRQFQTDTQAEEGVIEGIFIDLLDFVEFCSLSVNDKKKFEKEINDDAKVIDKSYNVIMSQYSEVEDRSRNLKVRRAFNAIDGALVSVFKSIEKYRKKLPPPEQAQLDNVKTFLMQKIRGIPQLGEEQAPEQAPEEAPAQAPIGQVVAPYITPEEERLRRDLPSMTRVQIIDAFDYYKHLRDEALGKGDLQKARQEQSRIDILINNPNDTVFKAPPEGISFYGNSPEIRRPPALDGRGKFKGGALSNKIPDAPKRLFKVAERAMRYFTDDNDESALNVYRQTMFSIDRNQHARIKGGSQKDMSGLGHDNNKNEMFVLS